MSELELKPCPFCGGEAEFMNKGEVYWIRCKNYCCYTLQLCQAEVVAKIWNRRANDE